MICRCLLCHQDSRHHTIRCVQCHNAPGCCACIWGYMRSRYNSGCPLCRAGDPCGENPLGENQRRRMPMRREEITYHSRRGRRGARRGGHGVLLCGVGRGLRGRGGGEGENEKGRIGRRGGRGRAKGRGTTTEEEHN